MFNQQEKKFLLSICAVLFLGACLDLAFKQFPFLSSIVNVMENSSIYPKVDVNRANQEELVRIPYIGEYTARQIIAYRRTHGAFRSLEELKKVSGIKEKNYERFKDYLKARP